jgi:DNA primase
MTINLEHIRDRNPIEDLVNEKVSLRKTGSRFIGIEHDSLVVTPKTGFYFWNSKNEHGDVFDFVGRYHLNYGSSWDSHDSDRFMEAVRFLAKRAGIRIDDNPAFHKSAGWSFRQLVTRLHEALLSHPPALNYASKARGWSLSNIRASRLGYMPADKRPLLTDLNLPDSWRSVIQRFPAGMLVYLHLQDRKLVYLSGRSIEGKRHYNAHSALTKALTWN